jgi:hypothetical protein
LCKIGLFSFLFGIIVPKSEVGSQLLQAAPTFNSLLLSSAAEFSANWQQCDHERCAFREEGFDTVEEILDYIEDTFPLPSLLPNSPLAEAATEDFFSKFCFYIKVNLM